MILTLTPAYGKDYPSRVAAKEGWTSGNDWNTEGFCVVTGIVRDGLLSIRDSESLKKLGITDVNLRYKRRTAEYLISLTPPPAKEPIAKEATRGLDDMPRNL